LLDLNGHNMTFAIGGLGALGLRSGLNILVGSGAAGGDGIIDSTAAAHPGTRIGIGIGPVRMKLTVAGDADLNGTVGFADLVAVAQHYGSSGFWDTGDFNYDQKVDFADLVLLAQHYGTSLPAGAIPGAPPDFQADEAAAFAAVPEPGVSGLIGLAALAALRRPRH
jgi:hypothetical protein